MNMIRPIVTIAIFFGAIVLPWYAVLPALLLALLYFTAYYEAFALGIAMDALYGIPLLYFFNLACLFTVAACMLFCIAEFFRPRLRFQVR
jgi:hypothetical protein